MIALLFLLLSLAIGLAMSGRRGAGCGVFALAMVLGLLWFNHHATSSLAIQL